MTKDEKGKYCHDVWMFKIREKPERRAEQFEQKPKSMEDTRLMIERAEVEAAMLEG